MSIKKSLQFSTWMDSQHATLAGTGIEHGNIPGILAHLKKQERLTHPNNTAENHRGISFTFKFFKDIAARMANLMQEQLHEQFIKFLAGTHRPSTAVAAVTVSNTISDKKLIAFLGKRN